MKSRFRVLGVQLATKSARLRDFSTILVVVVVVVAAN